MLIVYGTRTTKKNMGSIERQNHCGCCGNMSHHEKWRMIDWFTLYWIPLIPYRFRYFQVCPHCQNAFKLTREEAKERVLLP